MVFFWIIVDSRSWSEGNSSFSWKKGIKNGPFSLDEPGWQKPEEFFYDLLIAKNIIPSQMVENMQAEVCPSYFFVRKPYFSAYWNN